MGLPFLYLYLQCQDEWNTKSVWTPWGHIVGVEVQLYSFLIRILGRSEWPNSRFGRFPHPPQHPRPGITPLVLINQDAAWVPAPLWKAYLGNSRKIYAGSFRSSAVKERALQNGSRVQDSAHLERNLRRLYKCVAPCNKIMCTDRQSDELNSSVAACNNSRKLTAGVFRAEVIGRPAQPIGCLAGSRPPGQSCLFTDNPLTRVCVRVNPKVTWNWEQRGSRR